MKIIKLNDGQLITVGSNKDILDIIADNFSYELSKELEDILENSYEQLCDQDTLEIEIEECERTLCSKESMIDNALDDVKDVLQYIKETDELDKDELSNMVFKIEYDLA